MFCKNCGKEIDDNAVVCPNCGVATEKLNETAATTAPEATGPKKVNICAIIGFILSLACWGLTFAPAWAYWLGFAAALALSITGLVMANKKNCNLKGMAIAGIVLTCVSIVFWLIVFIVLVALIAAGF